MAIEQIIARFLRDNLVTAATTPSERAVLNMLASAEYTLTTLRKSLTVAIARNVKLDALEEAGVDNWEGYGDAMAELHTEAGEV